MHQPEAMQEDRDNWNNEEMLEAAVQLINLDSDLQSSGTSSTSTSPPESDSDCDNARGLVSRPIAQEKYRFRSATKRFNALKFEEQCFHFKEYLRSPDTFRTYPYFIIHKWDKQNFRKKVEHFTWNEHRQKVLHAYSDQLTVVIIFFPVFLFYNWKCCDIPIHTLDTCFYFSGCTTEKT